uniref:ATP-binding protein n=1 Tax=Paraburkholderia nemoris TaxID=2793076 RepID=UPI0038B8E1A9
MCRVHGPLGQTLCVKIDPALNLDLSEWGDAFPDNRVLGAATLDRLRHGAYRIVIEGESFRKPKPMPENGENAVAKSSKKPHS